MSKYRLITSEKVSVGYESLVLMKNLTIIKVVIMITEVLFV